LPLTAYLNRLDQPFNFPRCSRERYSALEA
jgi:hypothetical protein